MDTRFPRTEREFREREEEARRVMRRAEWAAYFQSGMSAVAYLGFAIARNDWFDPLYFVGLAALLALLGYRVGRRHSAAAAALLVGLVVVGVVWQFAVGRRPALLLVVIFAWIYGRAYNAASEFGG